MFARAVALSEDGTYVASGSEDGAAQVMEASSGRRVALVPGGSPVRAAAFTAGNHLVLLSADGTVRTVDFVNKPAFPVFQTVSGAVVGISPRGRYFTKFVNTPGENSTLNLEIIAGLTGRTLWQQVVPFELTDGVTRYSLDEKRFVATSLASGISVYDAETGQTLYHRPQTPGAVIQAISDDGKTVAWATANSIELFRLDNSRQERLEVPNIRLLNLSPDGKLVVAAGGGPFLAVLEAATKREIFRVQQGAPVTGTAFSSDGSYLASSSANNTLTLSEVFSGKVVWQLSNAATGALLLFSHDGRIVAAGGGSPPAFQLIDTRTRKTLSIIQIPREAEPVGAAFSSDGAYLDIADAASITRHYLRPKDLIEQACSLLTRNFAQDEWGAFMLGMKYRQTCPNHPS
jgi:WD40 repeat protein